jgi:hypothetical protein
MTRTEPKPRIAPLHPPYVPELESMLMKWMPPTWSALTARFPDDQVLELVIIAGWYRLLSNVINVAAVELEPWAARFPRQ